MFDLLGVLVVCVVNAIIIGLQVGRVLSVVTVGMGVSIARSLVIDMGVRVVSVALVVLVVPIVLACRV